MDYSEALAQLFSDRENPKKIGNTIGSVISEMPNLQISILEGAIILYTDQLYANEVLMEIDVLKIGDYVKVSPAEDEQKWFVDYKVKKVGG